MAKKPVLGLIEPVQLQLPNKRLKKLQAKIDTGAHKTAIDVSLAKKLGFGPAWLQFKKLRPKIKITRKNYLAIQKKVRAKYKKEILKKIPELDNIRLVPAANGFTIRPYVTITFYLRGKKITTSASIVQRQHMKYLMLIGKDNMKGFLINPEKNPYNTLD